ncbi:MAG: hypothetical protein V4690_00905 [Patescibacteria group bacterium]
MSKRIIKILNITLIILFIVMCGVAVGASYYKYYYTKDYYFLVEATCDPETQVCNFRDCENEPDLCPPNGLSYYNEYQIKAYDFPKCSDNSCKLECENQTIYCELIPPTEEN